MIELQGVTKYYGATAALRDVDLSVAPGELVLLLGVNGAGKSTLVRSILGIVPCRGGIRVAGLDPRTHGAEVRARIGYMAQSGGLHADLTVRETVAFYGSLRGTDDARAAALLDSVGLTEALEARVGELSGGMRQRLGFALALLSDPPVLLLDEPTASLDAASRRALAQRLRLLADEGKTILLSTHSDSQLDGLADRAVTLEAGRVVFDRRLRTSPIPGFPPRPRSGGVDNPSGLARPERGAPAPRPAGAEAARPARPWVQVMRKGMRDALHDRWLIGYALLLAGLGAAAALLGLRSSAGMGLQMFGRTTATLTNLCLMLAPLVGLSMGAAAIAGERDRGTLETLLAQPLERRDLLLGKYFGLLLSLAVATLVGFAPAAVVIARYAGVASLPAYALFPLLSILLIAAMTSIGLLLSVRSQSGGQAQGRAVLVWFTFVLMYDLLLMGALITAGLGSTALTALLVANPVDSARVLVVLALEPDLYLLGPAGALLTGRLGSAGTAVLLLFMLGAWTVTPLALAAWSFRLGSPRPGRQPKWSRRGNRAVIEAQRAHECRELHPRNDRRVDSGLSVEGVEVS